MLRVVVGLELGGRDAREAAPEDEDVECHFFLRKVVVGCWWASLVGIVGWEEVEREVS